MFAIWKEYDSGKIAMIRTYQREGQMRGILKTRKKQLTEGQVRGGSVTDYLMKAGKFRVKPA